MTIRARLALIYVGAIVLTIGLVGAFVWWQFESALRSSLDQTLETRAAATISTLENDNQSGLQEGDSTGPPGVFVAIFDGDGGIIDSTADTPSGVVAPTSGTAMPDATIGPSTYAFRAVAGESGLVAVAGTSLDAFHATLDRLARSLILVGGIAAVGSLAGGWWIAGRALRPVALITAEASQIGAADIERRLPVPPHDDEIRALATTLNGMLNRVADALRRQRTFVASASHDLRTPIAAIQAELELAGDPRTTDPEVRAAVHAAHADAIQLGVLAKSLLDLAAADADGRALVRSPVRTDLVLESVVQRMEPAARRGQVTITCSAPDRVIRIDRVRLEQALANVIGNAVAYSPEGGHVEVIAHVAPVPGVGAASPTVETILVIEVFDRGRGVPASFADRLFEPFQRGPGAPGSGAGLGMATAAAAVHAHHGSIGFESRTGGGTRFWIQIPV